MKFTYIALATAFSMYLAVGVAGRALPHSPPELVLASHGLAIACLLSCALALNHSKTACILLASATLLYLAFGLYDSAVTRADRVGLLQFTLKLSGTVCGCLSAAVREEKEEAERDNDMVASIERVNYLSNRPSGS